MYKRQGEGENETTVLAVIQKEIDSLLPLIDKYVFGFDDEEIEQAIGRLLSEQNYTISTAESCTGGYLAHKITSVSGSSAWFQGGMIPYSNAIKIEQLGVPQEILETYGAVSENVVKSLAENVRKKFNTDVGLSVSGVAGPSGGSIEKPVGTVWIAYADHQKTVAKKFYFTQDRMLNIQYTATAALNMLRLNLNGE